MRKLVVSAWVTLDGVFDADTMERWFNPYDSEDRLKYIQATILGSDALLLGRATYEMLAPYWSSMKNNEFGIGDRMNSAPKYVVSSTLKRPEWNNSTIIKGDVLEEVVRLKKQSGRDILVPGSATLVGSLARAGLIDEYRLLIHPVVMGSGKRFFPDGMAMTRLELTRTKTFSHGVMLLCYVPSPQPQSKEGDAH